MTNDTPLKQNSFHTQRLDEWQTLDEDAYHYHLSQWDTQKRSTTAFEDFAKDHISLSKNIIDMGAGAGASTAAIASRHKGVNFTAFDYSEELIRAGSRIAAEKSFSNLSFQQGDWYGVEETNKYDGCISLQTLMGLPDYRRPLETIFRKIEPKWLAITSLFYDGDITCRIEVEEHTKNKKCFYNIYSLPAISRLCDEEGYRLTRVEPFEIDIDINRSSNIDIMGTYTRRLFSEDSTIQRIQISGPLLMSWYMLLIEKR